MKLNAWLGAKNFYTGLQNPNQKQDELAFSFGPRIHDHIAASH